MTRTPSFTAPTTMRPRQVSSTHLGVAQRLPDFLSGLDLEAGALLLSRRLVGSALAAATPWGRPLKRRALGDARLAAGLALQLLAQRAGAARAVSRGLFGFGASTVWELPPQLLPAAVALYLLAWGPLLTAGAADGAAGAAEADAWRLRAQQFLSAPPGAAAAAAAPSLYVAVGGSGSFEPAPPVSLAVGPQSLAVLDCGMEVLVYAGQALGRGGSGGGGGGNAAAANGTSPAVAQQQQQQQQERSAPMPEDLPTAVAPAVQYAHQLARGRLPVPAITVLQDAGGVEAFLGRLLPLHVDVLPLQLALLPALRELSPQEHGGLIEWHARRCNAGPEGGFGHFCATAGVSLPVEGGLMEAVGVDG
jgi:hypothetical protein